MTKWLVVTAALAVFSACACAAEAMTAEYSVLQRVVEYADDKIVQSQWAPRALIHVPTSADAGPQTKYQAVESDSPFTEPSENALYQIKILPGNLFDLDQDEYTAQADQDAGFIAYTKLVRSLLLLNFQSQLRVQNDTTALPDAIKLHMSYVPSESGKQLAIAGVVYAVEQDVDLGADACPAFAKRNAAVIYPHSFATELRLLLPESLSG